MTIHLFAAWRGTRGAVAAVLFVLPWLGTVAAEAEEVQYFSVRAGAGPHDVAPAADGGVWYTAQRQGALGWLDPANGRIVHYPLGDGSAPHGVITDAAGAVWITDGGLNAIVKFDPVAKTVTPFPLPKGFDYANLNTAVFDKNGVLWFTGQTGVYGRLDPAKGMVEAFSAPRGLGPYGITVTPGNMVFYASLAGNHIAKIDLKTAMADVIEPPTLKQGARRVWSDSQGAIWVSEWNAGHVSRYSPMGETWKTWRLPGRNPQTYAVYVDEKDKVWLTDFSANAIVRFDPVTETFKAFPSNRPGASVRQLHGRAGEVWGAESGTDRLVVIRSRT